MCEQWKPVQGYENIYEVSSIGRVRSLDRCVICNDGNKKSCVGQLLRPHLNRNGYCVVHLRNDGVSHCMLVHRLVGIAFIPNDENKPQINHKDGNKTNNCVENLEWCTAQENMEHAWRTGLASGDKISEVSCRRDLYCVETNKYYRSMVEAADDLSVGKASINYAVKHGRSIHSAITKRHYTLLYAKDVGTYMNLVKRFNDMLSKPIIVFESDLGVYAQM